MIELKGDMGSGKTTFTQGLAEGMGFAGIVSSPTFTFERDYVIGSKRLHHVDLYRLSERDIVTDQVEEVTHEPDGVTVIEWAGNGRAALPDERITIAFDADANNPDARHIKVQALGHFDYITAGLSS